MKTRILAPRQVLAQVDRVLAQKLSVQAAAHGKPLEEVIDALYEGRGYSFVGVRLARADAGEVQLSRGRESLGAGESRKVIPIRIAVRVLGALEAERDRENAFGAAEAVLLKQVASRLARFFVSRGKVLMRHAAPHGSEKSGKPESRGYQPASAKSATLRMAAGEGRRP
ncbi:MAG: hypothetical protein L0Z53_15445 [Acidobacteriales bacterium]|nr:hypothetical protein [Terriglobales bacterium]